MARALTGYGEHHGYAEHLSRRIPRTHPEKMALAAGVLMETRQNKPELSENDDDYHSVRRQVGMKALQETAT